MRIVGLKAREELRGADLAPEPLGALQTPLDVAVEFFLVISVVGEC
jgi:hypothetical protein